MWVAQNVFFGNLPHRTVFLGSKSLLWASENGRYLMVKIDSHYWFQANNCLKTENVMQPKKVNYCRFHYGNVVLKLSCFILNKWIWIMWGLCHIHILCYAMSMHRQTCLRRSNADIWATKQKICQQSRFQDSIQLTSERFVTFSGSIHCNKYTFKIYNICIEHYSIFVLRAQSHNWYGRR